jgi:pimeloyl-ACP methyl ester carboxylesterase
MNRLEVPLDYAKPVAGDVFKLALVKVPAEATVPYMGTVFLLQGLEPGVDFATSQPDNEHFLPEFYQMGGFHGFDIISWDWRGAGHSTPKLKCFSDAAEESAYAVVERRGLQLNSFNGSHPPTSANIRFNIQQITAHQQTFAAGCQNYYGHYLPLVKSPSSPIKCFGRC